MFVQKVKKVVGNPRGRPSSMVNKRKKKKKNTAHRKRMTPRQIKFFGTKAQRAALKRKRSAKRNSPTGWTVSRKGESWRKPGSRKSKKNPTKRRKVAKARRTKTKAKVIVVYRNRATKNRKSSKKRRSTSNPAIMTLGYLNPRKGNNMAKPRKRRKAKAKSNAVRRYSRRRSAVARRSHRPRSRKNSTRIIVMGRKRNRARGRSRGKRNPMFFGRSVNVVEMSKLVVGGLVGVAVVKAALPYLPAQATSNNALRTVSSVVIAFASGWLASKINAEFGSAVLFGGLMQAGSVLLNAFVPQVSPYLALQGGRGVGQFVPAKFAIPEMPIQLSGPSVTNYSRGPQGRAYGSAY